MAVWKNISDHKQSAILLSVPVVAIDGITADNVALIAQQGMDAAALRSGIFDDPDPYQPAQFIARAFASASNKTGEIE